MVSLRNISVDTLHKGDADDDDDDDDNNNNNNNKFSDSFLLSHGNQISRPTGVREMTIEHKFVSVAKVTFVFSERLSRLFS